MVETVNSVLIDARNWDVEAPKLIEKIKAQAFIGLDIETHDDDAHQGIKDFRGKKTAKVFDIRRTTITGFSIYPEHDDQAYYVNLAHADVENRIPWETAKTLLDARQDTAYFIAHNAPFEFCMYLASLGYKLERVICTLQMAVSAYGPDEYDQHQFLSAGLGAMERVALKAAKVFAEYEPGSDMNTEQAELFTQVTGKQSNAEHSYNGFISNLTYGYNLKKAVRSWFGYQMTTFEKCLGDKEHMGQLTGKDVASYGADDAFWAVKLFRRLLEFMAQTNPDVIKTYFEQELPMVEVFGTTWNEGMVVNAAAIKSRRSTEREECAKVLRRLKAGINKLLNFNPEPNPVLFEKEKWYAKSFNTYRNRVQTWAFLPDCDDAYDQCLQASGAVSNAWAAETGKRKPSGPNFTHYMVMRTVMYDLMEQKVVIMKGKVQSDAECRGRIMDRIKKQLKGCENLLRLDFERTEKPAKAIADALRWIQSDPRTEELAAIWLRDQYEFKEAVKVQGAFFTASLDVMTTLGELAGIEQRMKLYLTPYSKLTDPDTGKMYPVTSSMLATRRMGGKNPNAMQLAKRGESTYVRGFFEPDNSDHLIVSIDWTQIELVIIGDESGDPEFAKAYGQTPYQDLHLGAAADGLRVTIPEMTEELLLDLHKMDEEEVLEINPKILTNVNGELLSPGKAKKYWRTEIGKGSNFNYWYSGALSTVGMKLGWSTDQMWEATDNYRQRFAVAEAWRKGLIDEVKANGYITLPDGHRRTRFEATPLWRQLMAQRFNSYNQPGITKFGSEVMRSIQSRANNQAVNARVQGTCATLAKRSIIGVNKEINSAGFDARFMLPVHDELLFSVNKNEIWDFIQMAKGIMCNHPDIIRNLTVDATAAVGFTFEPFHAEKAPLGQIELDEAPELDCIPSHLEGSQLGRDETGAVVEWLNRQLAA
ncbi:DNA polymerase [Kiloniella sp.]|uniref:DNA polymerase n=1 Tax=Kiloniella sp. TaxID=1938587 RepID=UPI003B027672